MNTKTTLQTSIGNKEGFEFESDRVLLGMSSEVGIIAECSIDVVDVNERGIVASFIYCCVALTSLIDS